MGNQVITVDEVTFDQLNGGVGGVIPLPSGMGRDNPHRFQATL